MPGHCWERHPERDVRCLEKPRHGGQHFNWFTRDRWMKDRNTAAQATD